MRWRIVLHALDRTGPPVLARTFARWLDLQHPDDSVDVVALRGGPLLDDLVQVADVRTLLEHHEPWAAPSERRLAQLRSRVHDVPAVDATLVISVSSSDALQLLPPTSSPVVTWVVEEEEDIAAELVDRTDRWLAGAPGTLLDLRARGLVVPDGQLVREFVELLPAVHGARRRTALGVADGELLLVGAGIATARKGPDLFVELLEILERRGAGVRGLWIGGEDDPLFDQLLGVAQSTAGRVSVLPTVADLSGWLAAADVLVHPARFDSYPNVCLWAAASGVPVVGFTGTGGLPDMFGDDFVGAPYPDLEALADSVIQLVDTDRRASVAAGQRRRIAELHDVGVGGPALRAHLLAAATQASARTTASTTRSTSLSVIPDPLGRQTPRL